ncbi:ABC transporter substrate-binding protein [Cohnella thailandensis]|uniref:ABC transporter substrate-binding protein n=1 Tax=Cohnella thailandensis TaxID=557557 RepID=A0A841SVV1_9BACL|nr:ABC transporter substrate-binding protein [Cohnella thailandensis]MBB6634215.1 ABC transporter substrate-binding protein [Cohnella thailandensis]MBP1972287.1 multiple sugar transport system substrate-binding protein [Cohnella thailandensis]
MQLRKKSVPVLAAGVTLALALSGCSSNNGNNAAGGNGASPSASSSSSASASTAAGGGNPVEITFWNSFGGGEGDFVDQIIKGFNDSQKEVAVKQLRLESNEYYAKLGTALSSGKGPDVAIAHVDRLSPFVKAKQVVSVDDLASKVGFDLSQITQSNLDSVSYDGKPYAVPLDTHFHMFYYNKDLLQQAGLLNEDGTPKLGDMTPEGFEQTLATIQAKVPDVQAIAVNTPYFQEPFLNLYYEAGGEFLNADMTKAALNNDKALSVLNFYMDLYNKKYADLNDKNPWDSFSNGKAAFWFGGVWEAGGLLGDESKHIGAMPLPPIFGSSTHWASSHTLVIPSYVSAEKQEAAAKFMKYFSEVGGSTWGKAGHVPANKNVTSSSDYLALPYRSEFIEAQKTVKFAPQTDKYNTIVTILAESLQNIIFGSTSPEDGLKDIEKQINEVLAD